jgi:hypothetical protein
MPKTNKKRGGKGTRKNRSTDSFSAFQKEITIVFFEMLLMVKLFHWKTFCYATHKATDQIYDKLNGHMDRFMEVLLGKSNIRMNFSNKKNITLLDVGREEFIVKIKQFKNYCNPGKASTYFIFISGKASTIWTLKSGKATTICHSPQSSGKASTIFTFKSGKASTI